MPFGITQNRQMKHWVYIYGNEKGNLKIGLSATVDNMASILLPKVRILYLRPFELPFDAIAHKHLLGDLSKESVLSYINKHKHQTEAWLHVTHEI